MKKLNYLCLVLFLVFASCSNDDDGDTPSDVSGDLLGVWVGQTLDFTGTAVTEYLGQDVVADLVGEAYDVDYTLTFTENPNEVTTDGSYNLEVTTTALGQTQTETLENVELLGDGTWERSGNVLTIESQGQIAVATILELTDTTLKLGIETTQDVSQQGLIFATTVNAITTYTRQ